MDTNYRNGRNDYGYYGNSCQNENEGLSSYYISIIKTIPTFVFIKSFSAIFLLGGIVII